MNAPALSAVQSAHQAYRSADALAPAVPVRPDFSRAAATEFEAPRGIGELLAWSNRELEVETRHLVAAGGAVFFLLAGALCGAWLAV